MKLNNLIQPLVNNWQAKVLSLAAALLIFLIAQTSGLSQRELNREIIVALPEGLAVQQPLNLEAEVTIKGPGEQIFTIPEDQIILEVDLRGVSGPGSYTAPVRLKDVYIFHLIDPLEITYMPRRITVELVDKERSNP